MEKIEEDQVYFLYHNTNLIGKCLSVKKFNEQRENPFGVVYRNNGDIKTFRFKEYNLSNDILYLKRDVEEYEFNGISKKFVDNILREKEL